MKDITKFVIEELKPRLYGSIPEILPDLQFTKSKRGNKWISPFHFDGTEGTDRRPDRCQVTEKHPYKVWDNSRQEAKEVITLFMERNNIGEFWQAVNKLCSIVGIEPPKQKELTQEERERYQDIEKRRNILEASLKRQAMALYHPQSGEAANVADYVFKRGFTDWDLCDKIFQGSPILGYINKEEATALLEEGIAFPHGVGTAFTLSIPIYSGSTLRGIKFRNPKAQKGMQKYTSYSLYGGKALYNLTGVKQAEGTIVVVEGELDALIAEYSGLKGFVATGGGGITSELLEVAKARGIKRITLLMDADERGTDFVRDSIKAAHEKGISILVATLPGGEILPDGTPIHDIGEYLQAHTKEELQQIIDNAVYGSSWLLGDLIETYAKESGIVTAANEIDIRSKAISLANHTPNEVERELFLSAYAETFNLDKSQVFTTEALRAVADRERADENKAKQQIETEKALEAALALAKSGDPQAALKTAEEAAKDLRRIDSRAKYGHLLAKPSKESLLDRLKKKKEEIPTKYELSNGRDTENFSLPSGAITFICAITSHGKSTFLQNLALQVAETEGEGAVLYFSFEEDGDSVAVQFLNKYMDTELCRNYSSTESNNMRALRHYYRTGDDRFIADSVKAKFREREAAFFRNIYTPGKLRIYYEDYTAEELIEAIRTISSQVEVKAVFIDYIQLLSSRTYNKLQRREELKNISRDLWKLAIELEIPIVAAAQLNREAYSPLEFANEKLADSADLERAGNKILQIWNTTFTPKRVKDDRKELEALEEKYNFEFGEGGKIYGKLTKNRGAVPGLEAVWEYNGNTGVIREINKTKEPKTTGGHVLPF